MEVREKHDTLKAGSWTYWLSIIIGCLHVWEEFQFCATSCMTLGKLSYYVLQAQLSNFSEEQISPKFGCALSLQDSPADTLAILAMECKQRSQTAVD